MISLKELSFITIVTYKWSYLIKKNLWFSAYSEIQVQTPTGRAYKGLKYEKGNCGVSIVRSGEAMEKALQDCEYLIVHS